MVQLFATQFALGGEVSRVPLHVEVVLAQQPVVGIADDREQRVVHAIHSVSEVVRCVMLVYARYLLCVLHVLPQPCTYAGAGVLGYVGEYQSVPVAYYHVCI